MKGTNPWRKLWSGAAAAHGYLGICEGFCWNVSALCPDLPLQAFCKWGWVLEQNFKKLIWFRFFTNQNKTNTRPHWAGQQLFPRLGASRPLVQVAPGDDTFWVGCCSGPLFLLCTMGVGEGQRRFRLHFLGSQTHTLGPFSYPWPPGGLQSRQNKGICVAGFPRPLAWGEQIICG